jgi:lipopolysaccharide transport system ATP-binding protein
MSGENQIVIEVRGLGKRYRVGEREPYLALRDLLARAIRAPFRFAKRPPPDYLWALRDVDLEIRQGEMVGLIGRNGAGKSTLLKILARITRPTSGWAEVRGRVGSLLEVGTGFHSELTGRENVYLSGAILGMPKAEIERKFDEIVAFSEVERFLDTPLKHYSSGMQMRLAFAVAAHLEPEILLVDEVLAVGDAAFQKKCLGKMTDVARHGRTIIFVSHNMTALQTLCDRAIWIDKGSLLQDGPASAVISAYLAQFARPSGQSFWPDLKVAPGNDTVRIRKATVRLADDRTGLKKDAEPITVRTPFVLEFEYWVLREDGSRAFNTFPQCEPKLLPVGLFRTCCHIPGDLLNDGNYRVQLVVVKDQSEEVFDIEDVLVFEVHDARFADVKWHGKIRGAVRPILDWTTEPVEESEPEPTPRVSAD